MYIHSLAGFLQFLAGSRPWLPHLDLVSGQLKTLEERVKNIGKSFRTDVLKDKVERHARGDDKLDLEQVAAYLESRRIEGVRALLGESAAGRVVACRAHGREELSGAADPSNKRQARRRRDPPAESRCDGSSLSKAVM